MRLTVCVCVCVILCVFLCSLCLRVFVCLFFSFTRAGDDHRYQSTEVENDKKKKLHEYYNIITTHEENIY